MSNKTIWRLLLCGILACTGTAALADTPNRVTILYDAFGQASGFKKDWGFSALIEYGGKHILFDTGNNADIFSHNVKAANVDLKKLDFVVISHRHLDHTAGLSFLLSENPTVKIFVPKEVFGPFGSSLPSKFYRRDDSLPQHMRYFDGQPQETLKFGAAWVGAHFELVENTVEVAPGVHLIALVSDTPGTKELRELSLALQTPRGIVLIAGCSHPGIEKIVEAAAALDTRVHLIFDGFHLPFAADAEISRVASSLRQTFAVERLAPGHCTGEPAFAQFRKLWGENYVYAGVGSVIALP